MVDHKFYYFIGTINYYTHKEKTVDVEYSGFIEVFTGEKYKRIFIIGSDKCFNIKALKGTFKEIPKEVYESVV